VFKAIEQRRKLAEPESKRSVILQQMITVEQLVVRNEQIVEIVATRITDRELLRLVALDLEKLDYVGDATSALPEEPR
jgi:hypothetical protein